jgi:hypothetical protein
MKDILKAVGEGVTRLQDARPEDRQVIEAELSKELEGLQSLGYYLFGIMRVVPRFFDEHVMLMSVATIYITRSRSPKIVKANNMMVIPAILPEEVTFIGEPAFVVPVY